MRTPRKYQIPEGSSFHFMWRAINGEYILHDHETKKMFLDSFFGFKKRSKDKVDLHAFCAMDNHFHAAATQKEDSTHMSNWARSAHCSFALKYNKRNNRRGPVAQDRPKTVLIENQEQLMRVMFYIDWNPVEAGLCSHPSEYPYSSYRYYAYGEENEWTRHLTPPQWYLELGETPEERQRRYRELCDEYYREKRLPTEREADEAVAVGSEEFVRRRRELIATLASLLRQGRGRRDRRGRRRRDAEFEAVTASLMRVNMSTNASTTSTSSSTSLSSGGSGPPL